MCARSMYMHSISVIAKYNKKAHDFTRGILDTLENYKTHFTCSSIVVSKHGLYAGSPGSIPTAVTTMTAAGGDAKHVSLNHWLASPYQGVKLGLAKT